MVLVFDFSTVVEALVGRQCLQVFNGLWDNMGYHVDGFLVDSCRRRHVFESMGETQKVVDSRSGGVKASDLMSLVMTSFPREDGQEQVPERCAVSCCR
mmetsp:Transcript_30104/g.63953  ORF Transcript_30104/g.63953 Transcript_30104/m.63953 type:complete len:98 (+) Transcript_30104:1896-2189(+)